MGKSNTPVSSDLTQELRPLPSRWYCVSCDGLALLCLNEANASEMVDQCNQNYPRQSPYRAVLLGDIAAEISRRHALASDFQEFLYRCASQVPFEHAEWARERGAALLTALRA